jgi:hypothetical protein
MKSQTVQKVVALAAIVVLLLTQTASLSAASPAGAGKPPAPAKWTFMVYIDGDNNLDAYVPLDIETELAPAGSNEDVSVVVLADRAATAEWSGTLLFYVTQGLEATPENAADDWFEANMGDPQTLIDFVQWTKAHYPADHYALTFWNHGWSWRPSQSIWDETDQDTLDQHEIEAALDIVGPIDVIAYDACQMATIEVQATVKDQAQAIVHSQEYLNMDGIEYEWVIPALQANPDMTADELAVLINWSTSTNRERTGSAVALDERWDTLLEAVDAWAVALGDGLAANRSDYVHAFRAAEYFWGDRTAKDLYELAYGIDIRVDDPDLQAKSQAVMTAIDGVLLDEWHTQPYHGAHGISIFLPMRVQDLDAASSPEWNDFEYYRDYLVFSRLTHWDEFLDAFVNGP